METQNPTTSYTVIVPNHNGAGTLGECLAGVFAAGGDGLEVIMVDDASTDGWQKIAAGFPVRVIQHQSCRGAAAARNSGARAAGGEFLLFIDSDVVIPPDTFRILRENFQDPGIAGVVGLLQPFTRFEELASQYKNYYMHYTYRQLADRAPAFYTSIAAIRKSVFTECAGFDEGYRSATIEDTDFGVRLARRGFILRLEKRLQVDHIRRYTLWGLLKTGFRRAAGIARIALREREAGEEKTSCLTSSPAFLSGIVLAGLTALFAALAAALGRTGWLLPAGAAWLTILVLNRGFLSGLARRRWWFYPAAGFLLLFDLLAHGAGVFWGVVTFLRGRRH